MQILKTGRQVTSAVKNVGRLKTILSVFWQHGLEEFLIRMGLARYLSPQKRKAGLEGLSIPERLRIAFEALGPTFVKLGQLLANRPDMIPEPFIEEFEKLQDNVAALPFEKMKPLIERELNGKIEDYFSEFNSTPLASASIGQVYTAKLKSGEDVVIKVQRPHITKIIQSDVSILRFLAGLMEKYLPETQIIGPVQIVEEFFAILSQELDYKIEANNTLRVAQNFADDQRIVIPKVYHELSTHTILVLQRLHGCRINDHEALAALGLDPKELVQLGARSFFQMLMHHGFFHGDLHAGNLFAIKDPETGIAKIGVIDFGIVGRLGPKPRDHLIQMMIALLHEDYETLCYEYLELGALKTSVDFESFQREVQNALSPYLGLSLKDLNLGLLLIQCTKIAMKYRIKIPSDWMVVFKAIFSIEGLGRQLDPSFDLMSVGQELVQDLATQKFSLEKFTKNSFLVTRDLQDLVQVLPRQLKWFFRRWSQNEFALELQWKNQDRIERKLHDLNKSLTLSLMGTGFLISGALSLNTPTSLMFFDVLPWTSFLLFSFGLLDFFYLLIKRK